MDITNSKVTDWLDTETDKPVYGVKVKVGGEWRNLAVDGEPFFTSTWAEARDMCRKLIGLPPKT